MPDGRTQLHNDPLSQKLLKLLQSRAGTRQTAPEWKYSSASGTVDTIRRRLSALAKAGLIRSEKVGPSLYFWYPENSDDAPQPLLDNSLSE